MPTGPQRGAKPPKAPGKNAVWGMWHGGHSYAHPQLEEAEQFSSRAHARRVFQSRIEGYDPMSGLKTPVVEGSSMHLYSEHPGEASDPYPFHSFSQTRKGIRSERL